VVDDAHRAAREARMNLAKYRAIVQNTFGEGDDC
jgi:hypothetical protein